MKRIFVVLMVVAGLMFAGLLWAGNQGDLVEFRGQQATVAGWSSVTDHYYVPSCWYDTTHEFDTLVDTTYTAWFRLGGGAMSDIAFKYMLSVTDTFAAADSVDSVWLSFQFCADPVHLPTYTFSYDTAAITANQSSYTTIVLTWADSLKWYPGYNHARARIIYRCVMDSTEADWGTGCATKDVFSEHLPITLATAYYPLWK